MKRTKFLLIAVRVVIVFVVITMLCQKGVWLSSAQAQEQKSATSVIDLPTPIIDGSTSIEKAL